MIGKKRKNKKCIANVGDLIRELSKYNKKTPVRVEYAYDSGCETCGVFTEEGRVAINDLETRIIISHEE